MCKTLEEIRAARRLAEQNIYRLVKQELDAFTQDTGLPVHGLAVTMATHHDSSGQVDASLISDITIDLGAL